MFNRGTITQLNPLMAMRPLFQFAASYRTINICQCPPALLITKSRKKNHMDKSRFYGSCHCGAIKFSVPRSLDMTAVRRCDCSLCKRRGAIMLACPIDEVHVEKGAKFLMRYKWNTKVATHHFCSKCGIMTHHQRRTTPDICGINIGCIDELDYRSFKDVPMNNGIDFTLIDD